jgi:hypothetical protein
VEKALEKSSEGKAETLFYKIELYLEMMGVQFCTEKGYLTTREQRDKVHNFVEGRIDELGCEAKEGLGEGMAAYIRRALKKIREMA